MGDPVGLRGDECWRCIIEELRKAKHADAANGLRDALDAPPRDRALRLFETMNPHFSGALDHAAQTCQLALRCQG
jgi:hypothetical protein